MKLHKSGWFGLVLSVAILGACEDKTEVVIPEPDPDPITLNLVPDELDLFVGQTGQLVAVVTGGDETTARTATFTSSNNAVATVNAQGVVTAVSVGTAQITARATADANAADVTNVRVSQDPADVPPTISIQSVTTGNTNTPVQINNVFGQIDITANLEVPPGAEISAVEWLIDNTVVCRQNFTGSTGDASAQADEAQAQVELVCSVNTAAFDATTGAVTFANGPHTVSVRVIGANGTVVATAPPTPFSNLIFNNTNFISATITSSRGSAQAGAGPRSVAQLGSLFNAGDITFTLLPVNFGPAANNIANATVIITSSGTGVTGNVGCTTTGTLATDPTIAAIDGGAGNITAADPTGTLPNCPAASAARLVNAPVSGTPAQGSFTVVFPENATLANNGVANVEDVFTVAINSITAGGQAGPTCINPTPVFNPQGPFCGTFFQNPLRIDNLAPRVAQLSIVRPNQYFNSTFVPNHAAGSAPCIAPCARTVDYGVDRQTEPGNSQFFAGTATNALVDVTAGFGGLPETQVSTTNLFQLVVRDALQNSRSVFATTTPSVVATLATAANILRFGIDNTAPTLTVTSGPPDQSTNCPIPPSNPMTCAGQTSWVIAFTDAGIGPSGFNVNPVSVKLERVNAAATVCVHPDTGAAVSCTVASGFVPDDGLITIPAVNAYYALTVFVTDAAGNSSTQTTRLTLRDNTAPVAGGIASPSQIVGGQSVAFTAALSDDVELGDLLPYYTFGAWGHLSEPRQTIGTYGPSPLTTTDGGSVTIGAFIKSVETTAGGLPTGTVAPATGFAYAVRDVAGVQLADQCPAAGAGDGTTTQNCMLRRVDITAAVNTANTFPAFTALNALNAATPGHGLFGQSSPSATTICTLITGDCTPTSTPKTTTLTATLTGPAGTFANPFSRVQFYWQDQTGHWIFIGQGTVTVTDNTVLNTRTYTFSTVWTPAGALLPGTADFATSVIAVGIDANGSALVSGQQGVILRQL